MIRCLLLLSLLLPAPLWAEEQPQLWGHGVKTCRDYLAAFAGTEQGQEAAIQEYMRYQDWLGGFVTGLSLATGRDMLRGVTVEGALRRLQVQCDDRPDDDFFTTALALLRQLGELQ